MGKKATKKERKEWNTYELEKESINIGKNKKLVSKKNLSNSNKSIILGYLK